MEKLIVNGDTPISCFRGVVYENVVVGELVFAAPGGPVAGAPLLHAP